ncbi:hypothetical protein Tco_1563088 [Tanacetum coccineum]
MHRRLMLIIVITMRELITCGTTFRPYVMIVSKQFVTPLRFKAVEEDLRYVMAVHILGMIVQLPITTRLVFVRPQGVAYEGPSIPTNPSPKKVVERETEETTDKEQTNFQGSTAQIPPPVIPISIPEPDVPKTLPKTTPIPESDIPKSLPKPNIPYPSH